MLITRKTYTGSMDVLTRTELSTEAFEAPVRAILTKVKEEGDRALFEYTERFDHVRTCSLEVTPEEISEALDAVGKEFLGILERASERIRAYHAMQLRQSQIRNEENGNMTGLLIRPLDRVGLYVPGGKALYPSSVLMNAIPAVVAGVPEVVMVSPPQRDGLLDPRILAAAKVAGVSRIFKVGGAQAIAALAYGTESVPRVDKIVGPGNIYVATAKKLVFGQVNVDSIAGPSEILVLADDSADPVYVAADMLSQAEHDEMAGSVLITDSAALADAVEKELERQTEAAPRKDIITAALKNRGLILEVGDLEEGVEMANAYAPEHMELCVREPLDYVPKIRHAGALFLGTYSPEPMGDYMAGPNHVLPTGGTARFFSPLGVDDFIKKTSLVYLSRGGFGDLARDVVSFAEAEGLYAHAQAVKTRLEKEGL